MTGNPSLRLRHAPIVEAVFEAECDLPPGFDLALLQAGVCQQFGPVYPKFRTQFLQEHEVETKAGVPPSLSVRHAIVALQCRAEDERQVVQVRNQGFAFNRLAPYTSLDDYLPEIERTWRLYVALASPVDVRNVRLRYINRILVPMAQGPVDLNDYFTVSPRLPGAGNLQLASFFGQQQAVDKDTGFLVNLVLAAQPPENDRLPVILDIGVSSSGRADPADWPAIGAIIVALRSLKNRIFRHSLTDQCIQLFQ